MRYLLSILYLLILLQAPAQTSGHFGQRLIIGNSVTYIWEPNAAIPNRYHEITWNKNIAVNINKRIYLGLSYQNIFTRGSSYSEVDLHENYFLTGLFTQFDFMPKKKNRLFLEASWNYGNYCTCGQRDPYRQEGLQYLGLGGGYDLPLNKFLSLDLSFVVYKILDDVVQKYAYTQYIIGLNFDLAKP